MTPTTLFLLFIFAAVRAACPSPLLDCNGQCYNPQTNSCPTDEFSSKPFLCPSGYSSCNGACFSPSTYSCQNGRLGPKASASPVVSSTASTSRSTTRASAPTSSSCNGAGCGSGLCNCNGACFTPGQYNCAVDAANGKNVLCYQNYGACNGQCYDTTKQVCVNGALRNIGAATSSTGSPTPTPSSSAPASSTSANPTSSSASPARSTANPTSSTTKTPTTTSNPVVNPTPVANQYPKQTADLRIINSCKSTLWFEARYGAAGAPIPGQSTTAVIAPPGSYVDYVIPDTGLPGTRFWAKYGCDSNGKNCLIGDQMQYWPNPPGGCPANGCTPPVDSLFEATWGCRPGAACNANNPTTWFDTSQVDGWTIPYKLTPNGDTSQCDCVGSNCGFKGVDASTLDLSKCPQSENLATSGQTTIALNGKQVSLSSVDLRIIEGNQVLGCMSPCKKLNWGTPYGLAQPESSGSTMWMCCPTPDPSNCSPSNGCVLPDVCRAGPIVNTQYVSAVHTMAPGVYSFSYDDGVGLHACPAGVATYTMEFCPSGSAQYPGTV